MNGVYKSYKKEKNAYLLEDSEIFRNLKALNKNEKSNEQLEKLRPYQPLNEQSMSMNSSKKENARNKSIRESNKIERSIHQNDCINKDNFSHRSDLSLKDLIDGEAVKNLESPEDVKLFFEYDDEYNLIVDFNAEEGKLVDFIKINENCNIEIKQEAIEVIFIFY